MTGRRYDATPRSREHRRLSKRSCISFPTRAVASLVVALTLIASCDFGPADPTDAVVPGAPAPQTHAEIRQAFVVRVLEVDGAPVESAVVSLPTEIALGQTDARGECVLDPSLLGVQLDLTTELVVRAYGHRNRAVQLERLTDGIVTAILERARRVSTLQVELDRDGDCEKCALVVTSAEGSTHLPCASSSIEVSIYEGTEELAVRLTCRRHRAFPPRIHVSVVGEKRFETLTLRTMPRGVLQVLSSAVRLETHSSITLIPVWHRASHWPDSVRDWLVNAAPERGFVSEFVDEGVRIAAPAPIEWRVLVGRVDAPTHEYAWDGLRDITIRLDQPSVPAERVVIPHDLADGPVVVFAGRYGLDDLVSLANSGREPFPWSDLWRTESAFFELGVRAALWGGDLSSDGAVALQMSPGDNRVTVVESTGAVRWGTVVDGEIRIAASDGGTLRVADVHSAPLGRLVYVVPVGADASDARRSAPWSFATWRGMRFRAHAEGTTLALPKGDYAVVQIGLESAQLLSHTLVTAD